MPIAGTFFKKIANTVHVMRIMPQKKKRGDKNKNDRYKDETIPEEETGLAQREKEEPSCYCCGAKHYLRECKVKQSTPQEKWLKPDY